jgi:hypothetical protein
MKHEALLHMDGNKMLVKKLSGCIELQQRVHSPFQFIEAGSSIPVLGVVRPRLVFFNVRRFHRKEL